MKSFDLTYLPREARSSPGEPWDLAWSPQGLVYPDPAGALFPLLRGTGYEARFNAANRMAAAPPGTRRWPSSRPISCATTRPWRRRGLHAACVRLDADSVAGLALDTSSTSRPSARSSSTLSLFKRRLYHRAMGPGPVLSLVAVGAVALLVSAASATPHGASKGGGELRLMWAIRARLSRPCRTRAAGSSTLVDATCAKLFRTVYDPDTGVARAVPEVAAGDPKITNGGRSTPSTSSGRSASTPASA